MNNMHIGRKFLSILLCLSVVLTLFTVTAVASEENGSNSGNSLKIETGEVLNSAEQGENGTYTVKESGYYLINLRGSDGGKGQDVHIQSDGVGSTDECIGHGYGYGGAGTSGGSVSTLVYLKEGQTLSYSIGSDGTNYVDLAYRFEDLQRGCIHVYPNSNPIYKPNEYIDAGFGGGGGKGTWVSVGDNVIAGAAGGGGGGGSVAACANWGEGSYYGFKDPSGFKSQGLNGGDAVAVSSEISDVFTSVESFDGQDGIKSKGESVQTGEYWPAVKVLWKEIAPKAPKYELTQFEAGAGGESGTSYINKDSNLYYGDNVPSDVASADVYLNAAVPQTSGIVITFVKAYKFPIILKFFDGTSLSEDYSVSPDEVLKMEIPKPNAESGYFKGWKNENNKNDTLLRDYYGNNIVEVSYDDHESAAYSSEWYDESEMGVSYVSNAKAQAVCISDGAGGTKNAIRFMAMIDNNYASYKKAGFIISSKYPNPTIEAGYQYSSQYNIYKSIMVKSTQNGNVSFMDVGGSELKDMFGFENAAGVIYTNVIIKDGNEDKIYYATPYIVNADGEYVYGKSREISFNRLKSLDSAGK